MSKEPTPVDIGGYVTRRALKLLQEVISQLDWFTGPESQDNDERTDRANNIANQVAAACGYLNMEQPVIRYQTANPDPMLEVQLNYEIDRLRRATDEVAERVRIDQANRNEALKKAIDQLVLAGQHKVATTIITEHRLVPEDLSEFAVRELTGRDLPEHQAEPPREYVNPDVSLKNEKFARAYGARCIPIDTRHMGDCTIQSPPEPQEEA